MTNLNQTNMDKYEDFLASVESDRSRSVYKSYSSLGEFDYTDCDYDFVERAILGTNPKNIKAITTACNVLKKYAKYLGDTHLIRVVDSVDRKELWKTIKPDDVRKYISHSQYENICKDIVLYEEHNSLYYKTLFMAIYEGIYDNNLSVIKNLRAEDIDGNVVFLKPDDKDSYSITITEELADNLKTLSNEMFWEQQGRYGNIRCRFVNGHPDACFKTVQRKGTIYEDYFYRTRLKKISDKYVEYLLSPFNLFVSGMMYRITERLKEEGITLQEAFILHNKGAEVTEIISNELTRCRYSNKVKNFRELVVNYIDVFLE